MKPILPPAFELIVVEDTAMSPLDAIARHGADDGDVFWVERADRFRAAFVVEAQAGPEPGAASDLMMVALVDALGALVPPRTPLHLHRPAILLVDGAPFEVLSVSSRDDLSILLLDLPLQPGLAEVVGDLPEPPRLLEVVARHFLWWVRRCEDEGMEPVARAWAGRAATPVIVR
ncbi:MAG: hypothetical protein KDE35_12820 [Geminicoccaceae bacterium]|nr:hypothetical protein [Geminicoccaceae bacterium]